MADSLLQFFGRLHPVVLHLPIGLLVGLLAFEALAIVRRTTLDRGTRRTLAWLAALSAAVAAVSGIVLAREPAYGGDLLELHRWLGIATGVGCFVVALLSRFQQRTGEPNRRAKVYAGALVLTAGVLAPAGHLGAGMTHGENFLFEPFSPRERAGRDRGPGSGGGASTPQVQRTVFEARIAPILEQRCVSCHSASKREGGLALDSAQGIWDGGDSGSALEPGDPDRSEIVVRMRLPLGDDDHMPPKSKGQPSTEEIDRVVAWIAAGASFEALETASEDDVAPAGDGQSEAGPPPVAPPPVTPSASTSPPDAKSLATLREALVHVEAQGDGLLIVSFAPVPGLADAEIARLLAGISQHVADLSLARSRAGEATLREVAKMSRLRSLDLSSTGVGKDQLKMLAECRELEKLSVTRVALNDEAVEVLGTFPKLARVNTWRSGLSDEGVSRLRAARPSLIVETGEHLAEAPIGVEPEIVLSGDAPVPGATPPPVSLSPVNDVCPVSGAPVKPGFLVVHDGRVVGLCCEKCAAAFLLEPAKYTVTTRAK